MFELKEKRGFGSNIIYAVAAQAVQLVSSALMSILVPRVLGVADYSYWQLFVFYTNYAGMALLGINDGIFLRLGGRRIEQIDASRLKSELAVSTLFQIAVSIVLFFVLMGSDIGDPNRGFVLVCTALFMLIVNPVSILLYLYQATNLMYIRSTATMLARAVYVVFLVVALAMGMADYRLFVLFFLLCQFLSSAYSLLCGRAFLSVPIRSLRDGIADALADIKIGLKVMFAYYSGALIIGLGRMMIDERFGIEAFGRFSLSVSLINFILVFIGQVSLVLFPAVKRMGGERSKRAFEAIRAVLFCVLPLAYLLCEPACSLIGWLLPQYQESLKYLAVLFPICIFDCKMNLLCNTYLKAERRENALLAINVIAMVVSAALVGLSVWVVQDIMAAALSMVAAIAVRSVLAELYLVRCFGEKGGVGRAARLLASELVLAVGFVALTFLSKNMLGFVVLLVCYYVCNLPAVRQAVGLLTKKSRVLAGR